MNAATRPGAGRDSRNEGAEGSVDLTVDIQLALDDAEPEEPPSGAALQTWAINAYQMIADPAAPQAAELTIRIVSEAEMIALNGDFRGKHQPTNVLSFAVELERDMLAQLETTLLGDIVICHPVIVAEARQQGKTVNDHYAHMVTHGVLHLNGYDHQDDDSAHQMESLEKLILAKSEIANPYC